MHYNPVVSGKSSRNLSIEKLEVAGQDGTFYKAYSVDNKAVLVSSKSLEAMKTLVNLNVREREDSGVTRTPDMKSEKQELNRYLDKLKGLIQKIDEPVEYEDIDEFDPRYSSIRHSQLIHQMPDKKLKKLGNKKSKKEKNSFSRSFKDLIRKKASHLTKTDEDSTKPIETQSVRESDHRKSEPKSYTTAETPTKKSEQTPITSQKEKKSIEKSSKTLPLPTEENKKGIPIKFSIKPLILPPEKETQNATNIRTTEEPSPEVLTLERTAATDDFESQELCGPDFAKPIQTTFNRPKLDSLKTSESKSVRFLIYGHVKNDKHPMFLIQPYDGDSLLGDKKTYLDSKNSDDGIEVLIAGKFFPKNILEKENNIPKSLTVGKRKIVIDKRSIIFEEGVTEALSTDDLLIVVRGSFIKQTSSSVYTPSLFIGAERNTICKYNSFSNKSCRKKRVSRKEAFYNSSNIPTYTIETRGFEVLPTRTEGSDTIYETCPLRKPTTDNVPEYKELGVYENHPKRCSENQSYSRSPHVTESKTEYGDDVGDNIVINKVDIPTFIKKETIIYECGKCLKSKSESSLGTGLSMLQSKTEYGDIEVSHAKSTQEIQKDENVNGKTKHRKTDLLRRLNKIIFYKFRNFNE